VPGFIEVSYAFGAISLVQWTEFSRLVTPYGTAGIVIDFIEAGKMQEHQSIAFS
jgi:adenine deaminase